MKVPSDLYVDQLPTDFKGDTPPPILISYVVHLRLFVFSISNKCG